MSYSTHFKPSTVALAFACALLSTTALAQTPAAMQAISQETKKLETIDSLIDKNIEPNTSADVLRGGDVEKRIHTLDSSVAGGRALVLEEEISTTPAEQGDGVVTQQYRVVAKAYREGGDELDSAPLWTLQASGQDSQISALEGQSFYEVSYRIPGRNPAEAYYSLVNGTLAMVGDTTPGLLTVPAAEGKTAETRFVQYLSREAAVKSSLLTDEKKKNSPSGVIYLATMEGVKTRYSLTLPHSWKTSVVPPVLTIRGDHAELQLGSKSLQSISFGLKPDGTIDIAGAKLPKAVILRAIQ